MQIRVYYEDTDMGGIVYHANYLKFCERARSEIFFQAGSTPHIEGGEFVAASLEAKFVASARLGDVLDVTTQVVSLKGSSLLLRQRVFKDDIILFDMNIKLGFVKSGKIGRMSKETQDYLQKLFIGSISSVI
jgi:acyl-CoA thioester hydrolase